MQKCNYKRRKDINFINPYTFVPFSKEQPIGRNPLNPPPSEKRHTGVLKCRLFVRTPLGIPDAEREKEDAIVKGHKEYPFFSYKENGKDIPAIPGSSLRGIIRSVFETATDSCFSTLRENTGLTKRVGNREAYKPGILRWESRRWRLYESERYLLAVDPGDFNENKGRTNYTKYEGLPEDIYVNMSQKGNGSRVAITKAGEKLRFGDLVYFQPYTAGKGTYKKNGYLIWKGAASNVNKKMTGGVCGSGIKEGLVYIGETFAKKKHGESIFTFGTEVKGFTEEQLRTAYEGMAETLRIYRDPAINRSKGHSGYTDFEYARKETGIPVWYSAKDKKLSLASIGRTFYNTSLNELTGERNPCINRKNLCEACALFGMAGDESLGSRVRITDARAQNGYVLEEATLKILGQPRYSYLPFYARFSSGSGISPKGAKAEAPSSYDDKNVEIAGRKFYWHNQNAATDRRIYRTENKSKMNSTMELAMPGGEFCFDIYYDGITEEQLQKLMWCIHFGENNKNGNLCHKLGHGKPLGLGSVKIVIEENAERVFEKESYRWVKESMPEMETEPEFKKSRELKRVMDFRGLDKNIPIKYPYICDRYGRELSEPHGNEVVKNEDARHLWYQKNKDMKMGKGDSVETLPDILSRDQTLHPYEKM